MIVYHVCGISKLHKYENDGRIRAPVRAWADIVEAERFSKQTGRPIILRLKFPNNCGVLFGHRGKARFIESDYPFSKHFGKSKKEVDKK